MIIAIQNSIGALARRLGIVTKNLQMWLGFTKAEVIGKDLVVNGDFTTDSDWTKQAGWTISGGVANVDSSVAGTTNLTSTNLSLTVGSTYDVEYYVDSASGSGVASTVGGVGENFYSTTTGNRIRTIVATSTQGFILSASGSTTLAQISNVSVKEVAQFIPDKSTNSNNAKLFTGKALDFDGTNDKVDLSNTNIDSVSKKTISIWFNSESGGERTILGRGDSITTRISIIPDDDIIKINNVGSFNFSDISEDVWYRLVITRGIDNKYKCYLNKVKSDDEIIDVSDALDFNQIGMKNNDFGEFNGLAAELQVYDSAWLQSDVNFDYDNPNHLVFNETNTGTSIALSNLKGYWALSEGSGSIAYDSSGEGNNGAITGATYDDKQPTIPQLGMMDWAKSTPDGTNEITLIEAPNDLGKDILGNALRLREGGFNLDGSGYAEVADDSSLDFGTGAFSMECWVRADYTSKGSSYNTILTLGGDPRGAGSAGLVSDDFQLYAYINGSFMRANSNYTNGDWYHIASTRDSGGACKLYIDSIAQTLTSTTTGDITNALVKTIGNDTINGREYENLIDDLRLYSQALSQKEIDNNYKIGLSKHS